MIHPSTMAGPNWFTGSFGTTNPFQQSTSQFFRTTPFVGQQSGFGFGINPFQNQPIGPNPFQMQNAIQEIVRQVVPSVLASCGIPPTNAFQMPIGQPGQIGFSPAFGFPTPIGQTPFGPQLQSSQWGHPLQGMTELQTVLQNPVVLSEMIRQATTQTIQGLSQQNPLLFSQLSQWQNPAFQPFSGIGIAPHASAANWQQLQQQQNFQNLLGQVCQQACQAVTSAVIGSLSQPNLQAGSVPFNLQSTPFNTSNLTSQFGVTSGIPTGAGAF